MDKLDDEALIRMQTLENSDTIKKKYRRFDYLLC